MSVVVQPGMKVDTVTASNRLREKFGTVGFLAAPFDSPYSKGPKYLITNAHVLAKPSYKPQVGNPVVCGDTKQQIATLVAWTPLSTKMVLRSDIAIAELIKGVDYSSEVPKLGPITGVSHHLGVNTAIYTYGAKTADWRESRIIHGQSNDVTTVGLTESKTKAFQITGLFGCDDYGEGGDSGSPLLNRWGRLVGIHVGERKTGDGTQSMAMSMSNVLQSAFSLLGEHISVWHQPNNQVDLSEPDRIRKFHQLSTDTNIVE